MKKEKKGKDTNSKNRKKINIKKRYVITVFILLLFFFVSVLIYVLKMSNKNENSYSKNIEEEIYKQGKKLDIDLEGIIYNNSQKVIKEELLTEEIDLEYITTYINNEKLPKGKVQVLQEGRDGKQTVVTRKIYEGETLVREEQSGNFVTKASINKIVEVGTSKYYNNYKAKKGDSLYVTSYTLNMMREPYRESEKVTTISKDIEVVLLEIQGSWYKIQKGSFEGWVDSDCLTNINPNSNFEESTQEGGTLSKTELLSKLSKNMDLSKPSGFTLEQFKKVLSENPDDKYKIFEQNAEYFYYIERQYNVNGIFVASVAIHESNWGKSKISLNKKNLFGYGANDSNPYNNAYTFNNYSESIDLVARVFVKYYINPNGTKIYDGQIASGKYYTGKTISSVNKYYASDKNWENGVYKWMTNLYNKL